MSVSCQLLMSAVEKVAPKYLAEDWDNVGLQVGDPGRDVQKVMLTLDCTAAVVDEAISSKVDMIVAHHPLIFSPLKQVRADLPGQNLVAKLIRNDVAFYAAHTNLDSSPLGGSNLLADRLGLTGQEFLLPGYTEQVFKFAVFVPEGHVDQVREAMTKAGAGGMGLYNECFFHSPGIGTFRPLEGANPFIGKSGTLERVAEVRLETIVPGRSLERVTRAMLKAHPYELPAYDVLPTNNPGKEYGIGKIGYLPQEFSLGEFLEMVRTMLGNCSVRVAGDLQKRVKKVGLSTGSGGSLVKKAAFKGVDVFVAGDISHHEALDALDAGMSIIDPGHYATEWFMVENLYTYLKDTMAREKRDVEILLSEVKTEPFVFL